MQSCPSRPAAKQRKPPGRELERQVVVLRHIGDVEVVGHFFQKGGVGHGGAPFAVERAHRKRGDVAPAHDLGPQQGLVLEQALGSHLALGDGAAVQAREPHAQAHGHAPMGHVDTVDGDATNGAHGLAPMIS